jgi:hypothetical protein
MKLFSNKVLLFNQEGGAEHKAPLGFSTAPDWVEKTDLFAAAIKEGSLKIVEGATWAEGEKKLAADEKAAYETRIQELEAKLKEKESPEPVEEVPADVEAVTTPAVEEEKTAKKK